MRRDATVKMPLGNILTETPVPIGEGDKKGTKKNGSKRIKDSLRLFCGKYASYRHDRA